MSATVRVETAVVMTGGKSAARTEATTTTKNERARVLLMLMPQERRRRVGLDCWSGMDIYIVHLTRVTHSDVRRAYIRSESKRVCIFSVFCC